MPEGQESEQVPSEKIRKAAYASIKQLLREIERLGLKAVITDEVEDEIVGRTLKHHKEHLRLHNFRQQHVDGFKLVSWLGCFALDLVIENQSDADDFQVRKFSRAIVNLLSGFLKVETGIELPIKTRKLLARCLLEEKFNDNSDHGIWMNGLFVAFHMAVVSSNLTLRATRLR